MEAIRWREAVPTISTVWGRAFLDAVIAPRRFRRVMPEFRRVSGMLIHPGIVTLPVSSIPAPESPRHLLGLDSGYGGLAAFLVLVAVLLKSGLSGLGGVRNAALRGYRLAVVGVFPYALVRFLGGSTFFHFSAAPLFATALVVLGEARDAAMQVPSRMPGALKHAGRGARCA